MVATTYPIRSPTVYQVAQFAGPTTGALAAQRALILATQDSAGWLIAKSIIIVIAEVAAIVLIIGIIINLQPKVKLIIEILVIHNCFFHHIQICIAIYLQYRRLSLVFV